VWVETPKKVCLERGLARDNAMEQARIAWRDVWQPMEDSYIAEHDPARAADLVLLGTQEFAQQIL
jgi:uridine kinase